MRFNALVLVASAAILSACGGGDNKGTTTDSTAATGSTASATTTTPAPAAGASTGAAATSSATAAPITGTTHEVKMIGDDKGYRFEPANITLKQGDGIKYTMVSGGPHNVAFDGATLPANVKAQLGANMQDQQSGELSSHMLMQPNETFTVSFAKIPPGTYNFHCTPHLAMGMKGTVTVQ